MLSMAAYQPTCLDLLCLGIALAARTLLSLHTFPCFTSMTDKTNSNTSKLAPYLVAKFKIPKKNSGTCNEDLNLDEIKNALHSLSVNREMNLMDLIRRQIATVILQ